MMGERFFIHDSLPLRLAGDEDAIGMASEVVGLGRVDYSRLVEERNFNTVRPLGGNHSLRLSPLQQEQVRFLVASIQTEPLLVEVDDAALPPAGMQQAKPDVVCFGRAEVGALVLHTDLYKKTKKSDQRFVTIRRSVAPDGDNAHARVAAFVALPVSVRGAATFSAAVAIVPDLVRLNGGDDDGARSTIAYSSSPSDDVDVGGGGDDSDSEELAADQPEGDAGDAGAEQVSRCRSVWLAWVVDHTDHHVQVLIRCHLLLAKIHPCPLAAATETSLMDFRAKSGLDVVTSVGGGDARFILASDIVDYTMHVPMNILPTWHHLSDAIRAVISFPGFGTALTTHVARR